MLGLRQRILRAASKEEARVLLKQGDAFEFASDATRRAWVKAVSRVQYRWCQQLADHLRKSNHVPVLTRYTVVA